MVIVDMLHLSRRSYPRSELDEINYDFDTLVFVCSCVRVLLSPPAAFARLSLSFRSRGWELRQMK